MMRYRLEPSDDSGVTPIRVALVRTDRAVRLEDHDEELVTTAPDFLVVEIIVAQVVTIGLAVLSLLVDAPLEGIADPYHTPNPAKAPWYFLGLQELLHYFPPVVAGVLLPFLAVLALAVIPYVRVNWEVRGFYEDDDWRRRFRRFSAGVAALFVLAAGLGAWPIAAPTAIVYLLFAVPAIPWLPPRLRTRLGRIPLADWIMSWFVLVVVTLTLIGVAFRGPGWSWVWPWQGGAS